MSLMLASDSTLEMSCDMLPWQLWEQGKDEHEKRCVNLYTFPFRIGRREGLDLTLPTPAVSGEHAEITENTGQLWVRDLRSTNGTFVNGERVTQAVPLREDDWLQIANIVFRLKRRERETARTMVREDGEQALAVVQLDRMIRERAVLAYFQPIVSSDNYQVLGFEILGRSRMYGLQSPHSMFTAAAQLNLEAELSRLFRDKALQATEQCSGPPHLFLNTHPTEMRDIPRLVESLRTMRDRNSQQPFTLEVHESAVADTTNLCELRAALRDLNITLAYDDFGAGQARLLEMVEAPPDFLKFDMKLVQNIHTASSGRQRMLAALVRLADELGIKTVAEGIENQADAKVCNELGFSYNQGYFHGRPAPAQHFLRS